MGEKLYSQSEVNRIFSHISPKTLIFWVLSGLVEWSREHEDRRGIHREYSLKNLWQLGLAEELMNLNIPVKFVERMMARVNNKFLNKIPETWDKYTLILNKVTPGELEELDDSEKISYFHTVQLVKTEEIDNMWRPGMIGFFGNSLLVIMVNLRNVVDKVNYLIKQEGM